MQAADPIVEGDREADPSPPNQELGRGPIGNRGGGELELHAATHLHPSRWSAKLDLGASHARTDGGSESKDTCQPDQCTH